MKKSSLLHNPKDVLSRSFKPAKCKTALKLATSRMKLLKNKKEVQIKQMKRELAQLLESGQDQTARIRVEHVIREEKMMAAYDLLDIYCELIVARLPMIESQKECPIDLKEAITSVIFASPRCGDVPELLDARKLLSAKYGKEFVFAAIELRPNCGVSRLLVEKLSANAPDGQTKIKVLTKIAEEHNIKWDPKSFGQSDILPHDDMLNGPRTFEATAVLPEATHATPNFEAPPSHHKTDGEYSNFPEQNVRSSTGSHDFGSRHNTLASNATSSIPQAQMRPLGVRQEKGQVSQSFQGEGSSNFTGQQVRQERKEVGPLFQGEGSSSFSGQGWNMEFRDATSAAQAAAESAERASVAARAAAELSSRVQTATGPHFSSAAHNSIADVRRDEKTAKNVTSKHNMDYISEGSAGSILSGRQPAFQNKPTDVIGKEKRERPKKSYKDGHHRGNRHGHIASPRLEDSVLDETFAHSVQVLDGNLRKSLTKEEEIIIESSMERQSGKSEARGMTHLQEGFGAENFAYSVEEMIIEQSRILSSSSHASISGSYDEFSNSGHQMFGDDAGKGLFVGTDEPHNARDASPPGYAAAPVIFDDSGSDGEDIWSATGSKLNEELNLEYAPPGRNSPSNFSTSSVNERVIHATAISPKNAVSEFSTKKHSFAEFSESSEAPAYGPQTDNFGPVTFDDSDGASSENEADRLPSEHGETEDSRYSVSRQNQYLEFSGGSEIHGNDSQKTEIIVGSSEKFISDKSPSRQSSSKLGMSPRESSSTSMDEVPDNIGSAHLRGPQLDDENSDDGKELNFKKLTGGFRQKGYLRPPYTRSQLDYNTSLSSNRVSDVDPTTIRQSSAASSVESFTNTRKVKHVGNGGSSRLPNYYSDSDSDSSVEELKEQHASLRQKPNIQDVRKEIKTPPSLRGSVTYFVSKSSDSEDDSGKQVVSGKSHVGIEFSRRTKPSVSSSTSVSNPKSGSGSQVLENSDSESQRTPTTRFSRETPQEYLSWNRNSDHQYKSELASSERVASKATVSNPKAGSSSRVLENPDSGSGRSHATRFLPETPKEPLYWNQNSDQPLKSEHTRSGRVASKASFSSQISSPEENQKSSMVEPPASGGRKVEKSESTENEKALSGTTIAREDSSKKPNHVHPKLPDYDTIAARLQSLRTNRQ